MSHGNRLDLRIGAAYAAHGDGGDYGFDGLIDELRIYARALSAAELTDPEMLPEPGWITAGKWPPGAFDSHATTHDIDLTAGVSRPGQYEILFRSAPHDGTLEIQNAELVISGRVVPDRVRRLPAGNTFSLYRMEQTTLDSPTAIQVTTRVAGDRPRCRGTSAPWCARSADRNEVGLRRGLGVGN